jgi:LmbE family N-acetylglucosaminyl deacetylase
MRALLPEFAPNERPRVLLLGAHSDDLEIGCGATILKLASDFPNAIVRWVVFGAEGIRAGEANASARDFLASFPDPLIEVFAHRDGYFPNEYAQIKQRVESLKAFAPDIVFTHERGDRHQDHHLISEVTWNTFRNHLILEFEIAKYDGGLGDPNVFVPIPREFCDRKVELLMKHFQSQAAKSWFEPELFRALMRLRGLEGAAPGGYAEAFHCRKMRFSWPAGQQSD